MPRYYLKKRDGSPNWYVAWTDPETGRPRRVTTGTQDDEEAGIFLAHWNLQALDSRGEVGIMAILNEYKENVLDKKASAKNAQGWLDNLERHFGAFVVTDIDAKSVDRYIQDRPVSQETVRRELSVLKSALIRAERQDLIAKAPYIQLPPKPPARERYLTREEAARLLWASHKTDHLKMFIRLALYTGARPGAILELTWDRVDLKNGFVDYGPGNRQKMRGVKPIDGALLASLKRQKAKSGSVISWNGKAVKEIKTAFRKACKRAGLKGVIPYTLRHTAATWMAMAGVDLHAIGGMLGHTSPQMTARYAKWHPDYLRPAAKAALRGKR